MYWLISNDRFGRVPLDQERDAAACHKAVAPLLGFTAAGAASRNSPFELRAAPQERPSSNPDIEAGMTAPEVQSTISELCRLNVVTWDELHALADSYLADPRPGLWEITDGIGVDVAEAVEADPHAK